MPGQPAEISRTESGIVLVPNARVRLTRLFVVLLALFSASLVHATRLTVPPRVQKGGTCGLYALGMVMDYHHLKNAKNPTALVLSSDEKRTQSHTIEPTKQARLFATAHALGYTKTGGMFDAKNLAHLAEKFGYRTHVVEHAQLDDVKAAIDRGNPVMMAFDVNDAGDPGQEHGAAAHWTVLTGYSRTLGVDLVHAQHGWDGRPRTWRASAFFASTNQLEHADHIDSPGDLSKTLQGQMIELVP